MSSFFFAIPVALLAIFLFREFGALLVNSMAIAIRIFFIAVFALLSLLCAEFLNDHDIGFSISLALEQFADFYLFLFAGKDFTIRGIITIGLAIAYENRSEAHAKLKNFDAAIKDRQKAIELYQQQSNA